MLDFRRLFGFGAMLVDESADDNRVEWDDAKKRARIFYRLTESDAARLRKAARIGIEILFAAGAEEAWMASEEPLGPLPTAHFTSASQAHYASELRFLPHRTILTSAHPQATTRMGADPSRTTLNPRGETHAVEERRRLRLLGVSLIVRSEPDAVDHDDGALPSAAHRGRNRPVWALNAWRVVNPTRRTEGSFGRAPRWALDAPRCHIDGA